MAKTYIIAEAGVNHNGSVELAEKMIEAAAQMGVDAIKFQTFSSEKLVTASAPQAAYQKRACSDAQNQLMMLKKLELPHWAYGHLGQLCAKRKIEFLSTPFEEESLSFLVRECGLKKIKIASGEITNAPFLLAIARTKKPVILSTGMSSLGEIENALAILAYGYLHDQEPQSLQQCREFLIENRAREILAEKVSLLHCTTEYPAPYEEVNLLAMQTLQKAFGLPVGYSDHTQGINIPIAAVACGASIIEKHFTLDRNLPGPDHKASLTPQEMKEMVFGIRQVEKALGSPFKYPSNRESQNMNVARKSLVAKRDIVPGERFSESNLAVKRPGDGISPLMYWDILGKEAKKAYGKDEKIQL